MAAILVIDDRASERQYLVTLLRHAGHQVLEALDGLEAIASTRIDAPDLVIADIFMPVMDGFEFIRQLRQLPATGKTPVIFYTAAYDENSIRALAAECAGTTVLPKPAEPEVLLRTVEKIVGEPLDPRPALGDDFRGAHLELLTTQLHRKVADLEHANAELARKEEQLRLITDAVPVLIAFVDSQCRFEFANRAHQHWFGRSPEELRSQTLLDVWGPAAYDKLRAPCEAAVQGKTVRFETALILKDGTPKYIRATYIPQTEFNGSLRGLVALVEDLSEMKAVESALLDSKNRLQLSLAAGAIGAFDYVPLTGQLHWDAKCKAAFGLPPDAQVNFDLFLTAVHVEDRGRVKKAVEIALDPNGLGQYDTEFRTIGVADRLLRYVTARGQASFETHEERRCATSLIGTIQDVTERKLAENALRRANQDLQQFAYTAAHDLQEPLRNVSNSMGLLQHVWAGHPDEEATQLIHQGAENAQRMLQMIKDLLNYTRITDGFDQKKELVDASEILRQVLANLSLRISEGRARISYGQLPLLAITPTHLTQLFQNLIGNALKYSRPEEASAIEVTAVRLGAEWLFTVADNGIGFDPAYAQRIFGVFKRLHNKHEYSGTGIGLAICSRIVAAYGGRIWAEGRPGLGAEFCFTLPAPERTNAGPEGQDPDESARVSITEDDPCAEALRTA